MRENGFQARLIRRLEKTFKGCIVLKNDPTYIQGIPDLLVLYKDKWAALECKKEKISSRRANQEWYVETMNNMSYANFISPENEEEVFDDLQQTFKYRRSARVSRSK